ncbi:MAG: glycoside hydrolase family 2 TIM barrel-domain containing protein, partial [Culicoidibacterales bacterium]
SFTPSAFDLTPFIQREGENKLAVQVYQYSSGSWLEDQDFWRMSGIFREVYLYTTPIVHLQDVFVTTPVTNNYQDGRIEVELNLTQPAVVQATVVDQNGNMIGTTQTLGTTKQATCSIEVENAKLWSAEQPYLYELQLEVLNAGHCVEAVVQPVGIRQFEMIDKVMHINGQRLVFRGVNRHEFSATHGRAVTNEEMEWDVKFLKANNFNSVRTSHYPNATYFYELCDKHGLYVMDETNLETHGTWQRLGAVDGNEGTIPNNRSEYLEIILDRAASMLERDKNHPSIIIWSCGNESFGGKNLYVMSEYFRNRDASRLVHYEGVFWDRRFNETSDMESRMYAYVKDIREFLENDPQKPFILCEYTHAMGNSNGGMDKYIALEDEYPMYQGGFIWDYIDQGLWATNAKGEQYLAFGGDFGDQPTDYNFCVNGIVYANREASPKMQAIKGAYQPFVIQVNGSDVTIQNKHCFTNLNAYDVTWTVATPTQVLTTATCVVDVAPLTTATHDLGIHYPQTNEEVVITVSVHERQATYYAEAGHEIAFGQQVIKATAVAKPNEIQPFAIAEGDVNVGISGEGFEVIFARNLGRIVSLKYADVQYIHQPNLSLMPSFWRAPIDNDRGYQAQITSAQWKIASLYAMHTNMEVTRQATGLTVTFTYNLNTTPASSAKVTYEIDSHGAITVTMSYAGVEG